MLLNVSADKVASNAPSVLSILLRYLPLLSTIVLSSFIYVPLHYNYNSHPPVAGLQSIV